MSYYLVPPGGNMIKLRSKDDGTFYVRREVAEKIQFLQSILEDVAMEPELEIPITEVRSDVLKKVIDYCEFNMEENLENMTIEQIDKWERDYVNVDHPTLYRLILAANFLNVQSLLDLTCKTVADQIKGKTVEQIRKTFMMDSRFTTA